MARKVNRTRKMRGGAGKKNKGGFSLFTRLYSPVSAALKAGESSSERIGSTAGQLTRKGLKAVRNVGSTFAGAANKGVRNLTRRRSGRKQSGGGDMGTCRGSC